MHALEDAGFYCVDNLPVGILPTFAAYLAEHELPHFKRVAIGVDARNHPTAIAAFPATLDALRAQGVNAELLFIDASDDTLLQRFSETRRKHPLSSAEMSLPAAIERERTILDPLINRAEMRIDTTHRNVHELRSIIRELIAERPAGTLALQFRSFGFKYGVPSDADFVFDVRCLPNPYWELELRDLTGLDTGVCEFLAGAPLVAEMIADICRFLEAWIPRFAGINRSYLTLAFGCTGGRHRSVYIAERVAQHFSAPDRQAVINHRDV